MKIFTRHWNIKGEKIALLIHGITSSSYTWNKLANYLTQQGYHVIAPDLTGHGQSFWHKQYTINDWIEETLEILDGIKPDLIVGHSLGGLIATGVALKVKPERVILLDPAWNLPSGFVSLVSKQVIRNIGKVKEPTIRKRNPTWTEEEISYELENMLSWDKTTVHGLSAHECNRIINHYLENNNDTLIIKPTLSLLLRGKILAKIKHHTHGGIILFSLPKAGHNLHHDNWDGFIQIVDDFIHQPTYNKLQKS